MHGCSSCFGSKQPRQAGVPVPPPILPGSGSTSPSLARRRPLQRLRRQLSQPLSPRQPCLALARPYPLPLPCRWRMCRRLPPERRKLAPPKRLPSYSGLQSLSHIPLPPRSPPWPNSMQESWHPRQLSWEHSYPCQGAQTSTLPRLRHQS